MARLRMKQSGNIEMDKVLNSKTSSCQQFSRTKQINDVCSMPELDGSINRLTLLLVRYSSIYIKSFFCEEKSKR